MERYRVVLCDRQIVAEGLRALLQKDFAVDVVHSPEEVPGVLSGVEADVLLIEPSMPKAFELVLQLRGVRPGLKVMFLTFQEDKTTLLLAMRNGVRGVVLKTESVESLAGAIRTVMGGAVYVAPELAKDLPWAEGRRPYAVGQAHLGLTARQLQVLQLVVMGRTLREIGEYLGISSKTAEFHKAGLMEGLGVKTSADLIRFAFDHKLAWTAN